MALYGVLKNSITNSGADSDLQYTFSAPLSVTSNQPVFYTDTVNLKRRTYRSIPQRWEIEASVSRLDPSMQYLVHSVVNGNANVIYIRMPQPPELAFPVILSAAVTGIAAISSTSISTLASIPVGSFINFSNHSKVYMVKEIATGLIKIHPGLVSAIDTTVTIKLGSAVTMAAYYDTGTRIGINYEDGILSNISGVKFIEAL
jgi:hypothetical protein